MHQRLLSLGLSLVTFSGIAAAEEQAVLLRPLGNGTAELVACGLADGLPIAGGPLETGLVLLDAELNGQSALEALDPLAGSSTPLAGGGRSIELPAGAGRLLHVRRETGVSTHYAWWYLPVDGPARRLVERVGIGLLADEDPFLPHCGVSRDGSRVLFGTQKAAGGDLVIAPLSPAGPLENRTAHLPPLDLHAQSLLLGPHFGLATHTLGALVIPTPSNAAAIRVSFGGGVPAWISAATVLSPRGRCGALVAGASSASASAWVLEADGSAQCANPVAMHMAGAGHLPEAPNGPWLAVSDDGARCVWRSAGPTSECHSARLDLPVPEVTQLTDDASFIDTLDEVGLLGFLTFDSVLFGVGESALAGGFDKLDLFEQQWQTDGTSTLRNLSLSSGQTSPPFTLPPEIESMTALRSAAAGRILMQDDAGSTGQLLVVSAGVSGASVLVDNLRELDWVRRVGDEILFSAELDGATRPRHIFRVAADLSGPATILVNGNEDLHFIDPVVGSDWIAYVRVDTVGGSRLERARLDGTLDILVPENIPLLAPPVALPNDHIGVQVLIPNGRRGVVFSPTAARGWLLRTQFPAGSELIAN